MTTLRRACVVLAALVSMSGCATFSVGMMSAGKSPALNENARTESVPLPGFSERLTVVVYAAGLPMSRSAKRSTPRPPSRVAAQSKLPRLACTVRQYGDNLEHVAATHYGKQWKLATAVMFVVESALAAFYLLRDEPGGNSNVPRRILGGLIAVDAAGTAGLFFVPKRDVLLTRRRGVTTFVRDDCPAGLMLEIAGRSVPVDGDGKLGPLGPQLLDQMMVDPAGHMVVRYGSHSQHITPGVSQRCSWLRARRKFSEAAVTCATGATGATGAAIAGGSQLGPLRVTLDVAPGTLSARPPE